MDKKLFSLGCAVLCSFIWGTGFIAQDMLEHLPNSTDYQLLSHNEDDEYLYSQENLVAPLVKAIQELSAKNDELESRLAALEG